MCFHPFPLLFEPMKSITSWVLFPAYDFEISTVDVKFYCVPSHNWIGLTLTFGGVFMILL